MSDGTHPRHASAIDQWLGAFAAALSASDAGALHALFLDESHWRDLVAFTWHYTSTSGAAAIAEALITHGARVRARGFKIDPERTPPRPVTRIGTDTIEAIFAFATAAGRGSGVLRLVDTADGAPRAWTLLTTLESLAGHEERLGKLRPRGESYSREFRGPNWLDQRRAALTYADRDPAVLVVGGGQAGLSIAARLKQLDVDTLIVDRGPPEAARRRHAHRRSRAPRR
jgi:putative flavoprotein involved in K+ transport